MPIIVLLDHIERKKGHIYMARFDMDSRLGSATTSDPLDKAIAERLGLLPSKLVANDVQEILKKAQV